MTALHPSPTLFATGALALAALALAARPARPQPITGPAVLKAQARVSGDSARAVALARVPNGKVRSGELEREKGRLIYSFDLTVPGRPGVEEVNVDAMTGAVVAQEHESPAAERREARGEAKGPRGRRRPGPRA